MAGNTDNTNQHEEKRKISTLDVSEAVAWLCSDAARYITGIALPVDAGNTAKKG